MDVGHSNGPRSGLFSIFTATFLVMGLSFVLLPELTKTGMFGRDPHLAAEDRLLWQLIGAAIATVVSPGRLYTAGKGPHALSYEESCGKRLFPPERSSQIPLLITSVKNVNFHNLLLRPDAG